MEYNKSTNIKRNIVFGLLNKIITLLCPFAVRTIIIWKLGIEYVGLNSLFSSILQVLSLAELGFGTAVVYSMYKPIAEGNTDLICALLNAYKKVYRIVGFTIMALGIAVLPFLGYLVSGDCPHNINIYYLYLIFLSNTLLSYFMHAYKQSLLLAHQRNDVESRIEAVAYIAMYTMQIIALILTNNYYCYIVILPIATMAVNFFRNKSVTKLYPQYTPKGELPDAIKKDMMKRVYGLMLTRVCQVCRNSFDSIAISSFLGLVVLGRYQNYYYIMNTIIGFMNIITTSAVAGIGNSIVVKSVEENYKSFRTFQFVYNWIATFCAITLLCLFQPFMEIWVGDANMLSYSLVILMCLYFYSLKVGDVVAVYKEAAGLFWEDRQRPIVESIANLTLNFALVKHFGVYGVVVSTIITITFINIPWAAVILFKTYFRNGLRTYFAQCGMNFCVLLLSSAITYWACNFYSSYGWGTIFYRVAVCLIVPNAVILIINIKSENMKCAFDYIKERKVSRKGKL